MFKLVSYSYRDVSASSEESEDETDFQAVSS